MFAPDQQKVADEVARVTRRGGRIAIQAWTRKGGVGRMFKVTGGNGNSLRRPEFPARSGGATSPR